MLEYKICDIFMKILYIAHTSADGGSSVALLNIVKGMLNRNVELAVACPTREGYLAEQLKQLGILCYIPTRRYEGYHVYPLTKRLGQWCSFFIKDYLAEKRGERFIAKIIKEYNPDIVHTNSSACVIGYNVCKRLGIKHVWHIREYLEFFTGWTPKPCVAVHKKRILSHYTRNIAITKSMYEHYDMKEPNVYIYDGVIDTTKQINPQTEFFHPYFLFVGALTRDKGIDVAVKQFLEFNKTNKSHHLVIIGPSKDSTLDEELQNMLSSQQASEFVHWLGLRNDVYDWMCRASALLVPSLKEGFGFTIAEGMYCNTIVIGRDTTGIKEQFDKGFQETGTEIGLRFVRDEEIPQLMNRSISEDFSLMKKYAHEVVLHNYTIEANVNKIYDFYKNILGL